MGGGIAAIGGGGIAAIGGGGAIDGGAALGGGGGMAVAGGGGAIDGIAAIGGGGIDATGGGDVVEGATGVGEVEGGVAGFLVSVSSPSLSPNSLFSTAVSGSSTSFLDSELGSSPSGSDSLSTVLLASFSSVVEASGSATSSCLSSILFSVGGIMEVDSGAFATSCWGGGATNFCACFS